MRRILVAVLVAAFATSACVDSASRPLTDPGGSVMNKGAPAGTLSDASMEALYQDIDAKLNVIYANGCVTDSRGRTDTKQNDNKNADLDKMKKYAIAGQWTIAEFGDLSVEYMADKIIANTQGLISAGRISANCSGGADEVYFLLNVFKNQGDYDGGDVAAASCEHNQDCEETGDGWQVNIPANTFNQNVIVLVKKNNGNPPEGVNPVGHSFHFDLLPANAQANNPWTRYICWEGDFPTDAGDPNPSWIVMVRETGNPNEPLEYMPTIAELWPNATCEAPPEQTASTFSRGVKRFFAGLPFFPTKLDAYSPPRTFGGSSIAASPHWLEVIVPVPGCDLACLTAKADEYYGDVTPNKTAAMGKLAAAAACAANDDDCWNSALLGFISNVKAQTQPPSSKVLTAAEGAELMGNARDLMR